MAARVLVVDDDPAIRSLLDALLTDEGHEVRTAANGAAALEVLRTYTAQVILLDIDMPVMDGTAFAQRYREECAPCDQVPIIVISTSSAASTNST